MSIVHRREAAPRVPAKDVMMPPGPYGERLEPLNKGKALAHGNTDV